MPLSKTYIKPYDTYDYVCRRPASIERESDLSTCSIKLEEKKNVIPLRSTIYGENELPYRI